MLEKMSSPGWEKTFPDFESARRELIRHICEDCLNGRNPPELCTGTPDPKVIEDLLATSCGLEFSLETC